eukprot:351398-Chlamydomonas_euryale.AAC.6
MGAAERMPRQPMAVDELPAVTNLQGGRCLKCPRRADLAHQPGHIGLARLADACSNKQCTMGHDSVTRRSSWRNLRSERAGSARP